MKSEIVSPGPAWSPLLALQRAAHATVQALARELADLGLTPSEINVLANLADARERTMSELGAAAGARSSTLTSVLDRLADRGLISRGNRPGDRRAVVVRLTAAGEGTASTVWDAVADLERRALGGLPATDLAGLRRALEALAALAEGPG